MILDIARTVDVAYEYNYFGAGHNRFRVIAKWNQLDYIACNFGALSNRFPFIECVCDALEYLGQRSKAPREQYVQQCSRILKAEVKSTEGTS